MSSTIFIPLSSLPPSAGSTLSGFASTHAPPALIKSVWSTLELLAPAAPSLSYAPAHFTLLSPNAASKEISSYRVQSFLEELTRASFEVAASLLTSSVLAGRTSESDEYGDVGIWVGNLESKEPKAVLRNLGLDEWVTNKGGKIVVLPPSPSPLPSALTSTSGAAGSITSETPKIHMDSLSTLMRNLDAPLEFRVEGLGGGIVLYFLVGRLNGGFDEDDGYAGLIGVGVMADGDDF